MQRNFMQMLRAQWIKRHFVALRLGTPLAKLPAIVQGRAPYPLGSIRAYNREIIEETGNHVGAYQINTPLFQTYEEASWQAMAETIAHIREMAPEVPVILEANVGTSKSINKEYLEVIRQLGVDAITVHSFFGVDVLDPFLSDNSLGVIILCRIFNKAAEELQDPLVDVSEGEAMFLSSQSILVRSGDSQTFGKTRRFVPFYLHEAYQIATHWDRKDNCVLMAGTSYPNDLKKMREVIGNVPLFVIPRASSEVKTEGYVQAVKDKNGTGFLLCSDDMIFTSGGPDFAKIAAKEIIALNNEIRAYL